MERDCSIANRNRVSIKKRLGARTDGYAQARATLIKSLSTDVLPIAFNGA